MATSDSKTVFSDNLSADAFPERRSEILKKFNDLKNRNSRDMFFERPFGGDWRTNRSFSAFDKDSTPFAPRSASKEIPIKVFHEMKNSGGHQDNASPNSSLASSNGSQHEARIEPKVHHIPIKVEPRDDTNTELSRSSSTSSQRSATSSGSAANLHSLNDTASAAFASSPKNNGAAGGSTVTKEHIIPITVEGQVKPITKKSESPLSSTNIKTKKVPPTPGQSQSTRSKNFTPASHVTRVPVNQSASGEDNSNYPSEDPPKHQYVKPDPLQLIAKINEEVSSLEKQVEAFSGEYQDKTYLYLDEMLTRCMLKLDNIEISGRDDVRQARKSAINFINKCITALEAKVNKVKVNVTSTDQPMNEDLSEIVSELPDHDANVTVSDTVHTKESEVVSNEVNQTESLEVTNNQLKSQNEPNEQENEKMVLDESTNEAQESKEDVDKIEDEEQKSKCDESKLICNDNTCSQPQCVVEEPEDVVTQSKQISSTEMETNK